MVIDGRIHDFRDEDGNAFIFPSVKKAFSEISFDKMFLYNKNDGVRGFLPLLEKHVFGNRLQTLIFQSFITLGIKDGFIRLVLNHSEKNDKVIIPKPTWQGYERVCNGLQRSCLFVSFFKDKKCNVDGIVSEVREVLKQQDSVIVVLNTPCHNPSGYSLTREEFRNFITEINKVSLGKTIYLFWDIVYLEYEDIELSRDLFLELENLSENVICIAQYSFSKSFLLYGMSLGLMTIVGKKTKELDAVVRIEEVFQDTLASNRSPYLEYVFQRIFLSSNLYKELQSDVLHVRSVLEKRSHYVKEQVKQCNMDMLPYSNGWKTFLITNHSAFICNELKKNDIFFMPNRLGICIPVSSLTVCELEKVFDCFKNIVGREK